MDNLARHHAYDEVPEDSLASWDASRRAASEVINILWVLKKKYNHMRELLKGIETRLVDSIRLVDAIALVPPHLPILRLKLDVQGIDFRLVKSVPPAYLQSRVVFLDVEVRKSGCTMLYNGQEDCPQVLEYMRGIGFQMVLPAANGTSSVLASCKSLPYDNACEANAHFLSQAQLSVAAAFPLPYRVHGGRRGGRGSPPRVDEEHGRR